MRLIILSFVFLFTAVTEAAVNSLQTSEEYLMPSDAVTVIRGPMSFCRADRTPTGVRPFIYLQFGNYKCLNALPTTRIGKDRPESEPISPGIPFNGRGLE
ncbi:MAG: hypothetical protein ACXVCP_02865 [Bdellovibrio sp.]